MSVADCRAVLQSGKENIMGKRQRYRVCSEWRVVDSAGPFVWETADVREFGPAGFVWHEGAHRVSGPSGRIMRQKIGEAAWMDARRAFEDAVRAAEREGRFGG